MAKNWTCIVYKEEENQRIELELRGLSGEPNPFAVAVRATRMPMVITNPHLADNPIVFANEAFCRFTGYTTAQIKGRNCRFLQGPETDPDAIARIAAAVRDEKQIEIELVNYTKDGKRFWNRLLIVPVFDGGGALKYFFASQLDITLEKERLVWLSHDRDLLEAEVERRTLDLTQSEQRLRFALEAGRLGSWSLDLATERLITSETCKATFGREPHEEFTYKDLQASIHPGDKDRMREAVLKAIRSASDYDIEYRVMTPAGLEKWVEIRGQPFYRADGAPLSMAGVSIDVTERKRAEQHRVLLAAELNHRVKNTLATVSSIVSQTLRHVTSPEQARTVLDGRLQALSAAHDVLTQDTWDGATLPRVVSKALAPFASSRDRFRISGVELRLSPEVALAFSLALHELTTNAIKYGALSNDSGYVTLYWKVTDGEASERLHFCWKEVGGPEVIPPSKTGFGSRLIERILAEQLNGDAQLDYRKEGLVFTVEAPLEKAQNDNAPIFV